MVGLGVGNLLGVPQEGWPRYTVEASYPNGIRDIEVEPGEPDDDDLAQAIILAEAALEAGSADLDVEEIGRRFWRWAEENGRGIGIQTADVLARIGGASPRCARGVGVEARKPAGQTGPGSRSGGLGRVGQVLRRQRSGHALRAAGDPLDVGRRCLARNTSLSAVVTHADPRCIWSAVVVNVAVAMLLRGEEVCVPNLLARTGHAATEVDGSLVAFGVEGAVPGSVAEACSIPSNCAPADLILDGADWGYTLKAMQVALWCANQAPDFEEALVAVVSAGG